MLNCNKSPLISLHKLDPVLLFLCPDFPTSYWTSIKANLPGRVLQA